MSDDEEKSVCTVSHNELQNNIPRNISICKDYLISYIYAQRTILVRGL